MNAIEILEFNRIRERLAELSMSAQAKEWALSLAPFLNERECRQRQAETTGARRILDALGSPPLPSMRELERAAAGLERDAMLLPEELEGIAQFLAACKRMKSYLKRAEFLGEALSDCGLALDELPELREEIQRCVRGDRLDDGASPALRSIRRKLESLQEEIKSRLEQLLRSKKGWFAEDSAVMRNGRWVLPVKKQYRNQLGGAVVGTSGTGGTCFIEPAAAARLREEINALEIEEDGEVRRILYTLTALAEERLPALRQNQEALETLDFAFAKGKLSAEQRALPPALTAEREIRICQGRHPLLNRPEEECVPLDFRLGEGTRGIVITGPNTGGKTVALKAVGLLSMMAQAGLHVPAGEGSLFSLCSSYLCDMGDGQSIDQNLSTFSAHITSVVAILREAGRDSLVLLDELGSGTDPAEGMGIAVAILEELRRRECLFAATTHYPEVKDYAAGAEGVRNARMAFDRESLRPLYRLELGAAGESCALYIAKRLGLPAPLLERAYREAYGSEVLPEELQGGAAPVRSGGSRLRREQPEREAICSLKLGDSVEVLPDRAVGIVYRPADELGRVCIQVKGVKKLYSHQRLRLLTPAEKLYPPDYDFSILFDTVENRKARHKMEKGHRPDLTVTYEDERDWLS
ncbi:MAG: DNA mismatch repair protein MutS [Oscillospiraceae bacterium]|jgi:DNA mismatch repair protein MutS2|nr:DNA mismatch repair protein MutS [Oscillospiraceae bacterium]